MELKLSKPIAFFDLETTGTNIVSDRIVEISILKINIENQKQVHTYRINPGIHIPEEVVLIHGITDEDVKDCPSFKDLAKTLYQIFQNCDLAGYNSNKFDIPFLVEEFLRADIDFEIKGRRFVDVQNIFHKMEQRTLSAAYKFYCKKELVGAHGAEADTMATYEVLKAQIEMYQDTPFIDKVNNKSFPIENDIQSLHNFSFQAHFADFVGHIAYNKNNVEVFNFGKHKGKPVEEIFNIEPSYFDWMMKSDFPLFTKKLITSIKLRGFNKSSSNIKNV
ncbi:MAG TPA: exonuclease domain-containing protein [Bacteroidales bacterium]|mgnify:CR=1 FL=1|nr:exonuclease domain-containing protein [Bacteroidales bacterium]HPS45783.1 exonuclease domain-containing protein [Bacteroidales bacterium]HQH18075.1 exonuclease domain-containing protein [Bacteroidales bacterium]HQI45131.1 exonuclease domain-containing protein [Bacteroidales bacterium]